MKEEIHENHGPWGRGWQGHGPHHGRGRWRGPGRQGEWQEFFGRHGGWSRGGPFGEPGWRPERMERGLLRYVILSVLKDGPMHGYEVIKQLEDRTRGHYIPSPGTLYPTLQYLEDLGLVRSDQEADKRVYHVTDAGQAELDKQHELVEHFWSRFQDQTPPGANLYELRFAGDALRDLLRTVGGGLRSGAFAADTDAVRLIRQSLERCQNEIREILAKSRVGAPGASDPGAADGEPEDYV